MPGPLSLISIEHIVGYVVPFTGLPNWILDLIVIDGSFVISIACCAFFTILRIA